MHTIDIFDNVAIKKSEQEYSTLQSGDTTIPFGKRNLCIKAFEALKAETGLDQTVVISLEKNIPLGSGMGGGSGNAASVIKGINNLFKLGLSSETMMKIGAEVGSDVPFFIDGGSALATGRGIEITEMPKTPSPIWMVVGKPDESVSTGDAYQWLSSYKSERKLNVDELRNKIQSGDFQYICDNLYNAFEEVILDKYPAIKNLKLALIESGCAAAMMTGSGSAVFGLCENEAAARKAFENFGAKDGVSFLKVCGTV